MFRLCFLICLFCCCCLILPLLYIINRYPLVRLEENPKWKLVIVSKLDACPFPLFQLGVALFVFSLTTCGIVWGSVSECVCLFVNASTAILQLLIYWLRGTNWSDVFSETFEKSCAHTCARLFVSLLWFYQLMRVGCYNFVLFSGRYRLISFLLTVSCVYVCFLYNLP